MNVLRSSFKLNGRHHHHHPHHVATSSSSSSSSPESLVTTKATSAVVDCHHSTADLHPPTNGRPPHPPPPPPPPPQRAPVVVVVCRVLLRRLLLRSQTTAPLPSRQDVQRIILSAAPYLLFLLLYAINPYTHVLPVAEDIGRADLKNVSAWEEYLFPWQLHVLVSSIHFLPLDFAAAVPYLGHYVIPVLYPVFLYLIDRLELIQQFYRLLGVTMWGHYAIWLVAPTLPPWALDFLTAHQKTNNASSMAQTILMAHKEGPAFARIDSFIGRPFFYGMFVGNPVPFGSFPSGHVAWPLCILVTLPEHLRRRFGFYVVWVSWATLYTGHHYASDVAGALALVCGLTKLISHVTRTRCSPVLPL